MFKSKKRCRHCGVDNDSINRRCWKCGKVIVG